MMEGDDHRAGRGGGRHAMSARKWNGIGISSDVYCNSLCQYYLHVWLISAAGGRLQLDYDDGGNWLYYDSRDFRVFDAPKYVEVMFAAKFAVMYETNAFTFYEYRKMGDGLVKDDDPKSLRYHDAEYWQHIAESIIKSEETR